MSPHFSLSDVIAGIERSLPWYRPPPPPAHVQLFRGACTLLLGTTKAAGAVAVAAVAVRGVLFARRVLAKRDDAAENAAIKRCAKYEEDAGNYEPVIRDAADGEASDFVSHELVEDDEDVRRGEVALDEGALGLRRRRVAKLRAVRKVYVHADGSGKVLSSALFGSIVAQARAQYYARGFSVYNAQLARSFMVRLMEKANVRHAHINEELEFMVTAVFTVTPSDEEVVKQRNALLAAGKLNLGQGY